MSSITIDPPARLPVDYLSLSSLRLLMTCPTRWRRRYLDHELEQPNGKMTLGGAAHAALAQHFSFVIERGEGLSADELVGEFEAEWDDRTGREDVDWGKDTPGALKDSAIGALRVYRQHIAPGIVPVSVEREFELSWEGVDFHLTGFLDLEEADGSVSDLKMLGRRMGESDAHADLQPTVYLAARRAEGYPATGFKYHCMVRTKQPTAEIVPTTRTDRQLDALTGRIMDLAREIEWRTQTGTWSGAAPTPGNWYCGSCQHTGCPLRLGS